MEFILTLILVIIVVYWLGGRILRWLLSGWLLRKQREFEQQFGGRTTRDQQTRREGEVKVQGPSPRAQKKVNDRVGEYVDYEEVKK